jgi:hypothetical protein
MPTNKRKPGLVARSVVLHDSEWSALCDWSKKTGNSKSKLMRQAVLDALQAAGVGARRGRRRDDIRQLEMFRESRT